MELEEVFTPVPAYLIVATSNRKPQRMPFEQGGHEEFVGIVLGRILYAPDLLLDHTLLELECLCRDGRKEQEIGVDIDELLEVLSENFRVVARRLLPGEGVPLPPYRLEIQGNLERIPAASAAEHHVFE